MFSSAPFSTTLLDVPRAHIDPIRSLLEALSVVALSIQRPLDHSLTALLLNAEWCGVGLERTCRSFRPAMHHVISAASEVPNVQFAVLASTRPRSTVQYVDGDNFLFASQLFAHAGITLVEWVILGRGGMYCPRVLTDEPSRWLPH